MNPFGPSSTGMKGAAVFVSTLTREAKIPATGASWTHSQVLFMMTSRCSLGWGQWSHPQRIIDAWRERFQWTSRIQLERSERELVEVIGNEWRGLTATLAYFPRSELRERVTLRWLAVIFDGDRQKLAHIPDISGTYHHNTYKSQWYSQMCKGMDM